MAPAALRAGGASDTPRPTRAAGLLLCGLLSAAGHAALLIRAAQPAATPAGTARVEAADTRWGRPATGGADRPQAVQALLPSWRTGMPETSPASPLPTSSASERPSSTAGLANPPSGPEVATLPVDATTAGEATGSDDSDDDDRYLPRSALDLGPAPNGAVDLPYPADAPVGRFEGVLTLFVDAAGRVRRVRHDSGNLPAVLADEARQAFLAASFRPGVKDGRAVGSRFRVRVSYAVDAPRPEPAAAAASGTPAASAPP